MVISFGKNNAIVAAALAADRGLKGVLAIVDGDYDDFMEKDVSESNIIVTDHHDTEMMMVQSPALEKVVSELGSQEKVRRLEDSGISIRDFFLDKFIGIGLLRLYSLKKEEALKFRDYDYRHIDRKLTYSNEEMARSVANYSGLPGYNLAPALEFIEGWSGEDEQKWAICCGHDAAAIIGKALISVLGNRQASDVSRVKVEGYLRLGYERAFFYQAICIVVFYLGSREMRRLEYLSQPCRKLFNCYWIRIRLLLKKIGSD
ncbi:hypothetical protein C0214_20495 [Methylobacterium sp. DM1]|nr:hypothetical protein C0214_20495 [Methylobacterium sp. DM1]